LQVGEAVHHGERGCRGGRGGGRRDERQRGRGEAGEQQVARGEERLAARRLLRALVGREDFGCGHRVPAFAAGSRLASAWPTRATSTGGISGFASASVKIASSERHAMSA